jgi:hypothetical protein
VRQLLEVGNVSIEASSMEVSVEAVIEDARNAAGG